MLMIGSLGGIMVILIAVITALLVLLLVGIATILFGYGLLGWFGGTRRCPHCHYVYLTRLGHKSTCPDYPHPVHAVTHHLHHPA